MKESTLSEDKSLNQPYLLYGLLFCSGLSALVYEVGWVRMLSLAVGSTTQSASCVIGAFLGGLALGAFFAGKYADKIKIDHLALYGAIEVGVALVAPSISLLLQKAPELFALLSKSLPSTSTFLTFERLGLSALLLLLPTVLMGATLPIVVSLLSKSHARPAHQFSMLYGLNTLGAAAGSLAAAFIGFPYLGILGTIFCAGALNLLIGLIAIFSSRFKRSEIKNLPETGVPTVPVTVFSWKIFSLAAALLGFTALSYEILWIRLLHAFITSSTYAFTAMVSTFLIGLVIGSVIYNRILNKNADFCNDSKGQLGLLAISQYGAAVSSMIGLLSLPLIIVLRAAYYGLGFEKFGSWLVAEFLLSFFIMIVPATFIGLSFPIIAGIAAVSGKSVTSSVGNIYAFNTVGCILGSVVCGLVLIPLLGSQYSLELIAACTVFLALFLDWNTRKQHWLRMLLCGLSVLGVLSLVPGQYLEKMHTRLMGAQFLHAAEDSIGRCLFIASNTGKRLFVNGTSYSTDTMPAMRYMTALACFPALLCPHPKTALVVCFGIGTTAGALASCPEIEHLDICEISPAVLSGANLFQKTNFAVENNPKVQLILEDGRNYLLRTDRKYDIISFEPPPPCDAGINSLYSAEFYKLCATHLNKGGILSQWLPMHTQSATLWNMMTATISSAFQNVTVWQPDGLEAIALASSQPFVFDMVHMQRVIDSSPELRSCLERVGFEDPYEIMATLVVGPRDFKKHFATYKPITDDNSSLEFFLPYPGGNIMPVDLQAECSDIQAICLNENSNIDINRLTKNLAAMRLVREASTRRWQTEDLARTRSDYDKILKLFPDNKFLQWMDKHPEVR